MLRKSVVLMGLGVFLLLIPRVGSADQPLSSDRQNQLTAPAVAFKKESEKKPEAAPQKPEIVVEEEKPAAPEEAGPSFFVKEIRLEGNTVLPEKKLREMAEPYENRTVSFGELRALMRRYTDLYRAAGYLTSRAYLPPQRLENGVVTVRFLEGRVGQVIVQGNRYFSSQVYENDLRLTGRILRYQDLESALYFMSQNPDRKAKAYVIAGKDPGTSDILLKTADTRPVHLSYEFDNRGTKLTHRGRQEVHFDHNNFTGRGDTFSADVTMAEESAFDAGAVSYRYPLGRRGTTLDLDAAYVKSMLIGSDLKPLNVRGKYMSLTPGIEQSFVRTPAFEFSGHASFEITDSKSILDRFKTSFDRVRILHAGPRASWQDVNGRTLVSSDVNWGIPRIFGGMSADDPSASRAGTGGDFVYYTASGARLERLPFGSFLVGRLSGFWSPDSLPSVEQFRAGGAFSVRGYPESDSVGDYGYTASAELNLPTSFLGEDALVPFTKKKWKDALRLVTFLDAGKTYLYDRNPPTTVADRFLLGTGFGVRLDLDKTFSLRADLGFPIGDKSTDKNNPQLHIDITAGF